MILLGWQFERHQGILRSKLLTAVSGDYSLPVADFSPLILDKPIMALPKILEVVIWPVAAVDILSSAPPYTILFILGALAIGSWIRDLWIYWWFEPEEIINPELSAPLLTITKINYNFPRDTDSNGVVVEFIGTKPEGFTPEKVQLHVDGPGLAALQSMNLITEPTIKPLKLLPGGRMLQTFKKESAVVHGYIQLGTGLNGEPKKQQSEIRTLLRRIQIFGNPRFSFRLVYSEKIGSNRKHGLLFSFTTTSSQILNEIKQADFDLKSLL